MPICSPMFTRSTVQPSQTIITSEIVSTSPSLVLTDETAGDDDYRVRANGDDFYVDQYVGDSSWTNRLKFTAATTQWEVGGFIRSGATTLNTPGATYLEQITSLMTLGAGDVAKGGSAVSGFLFCNQNDTLTSGSSCGVKGGYRRTVTADVTDTASIQVALKGIVELAVDSGHTFTASRFSAIDAVAPSLTGTGTLAIGSYEGMTIEASTLATGTRKIGLKIGAQSGATYNALISDDHTTFAADYGIFLKSTNPSILSGTLGVGGANSGIHIIRVGDTNPLTGATQGGVSVNHTATSAATTALYGFYARQTTADAAFTCPISIGYYYEPRAKGAASTLTSRAAFATNGMFVSPDAVNTVVLTDSTSWTGNYGIYLATTNANFLGGALECGQLTVTRSNTSGAAVVATMSNLNTGAVSNGAVFRALFADTSGNAVDGGYLQFVKEQTWTSTASTQDASIVLQTCLNGTCAAALTLDSAKKATFAGKAVATAAGLQTQHVAANISDPPTAAELISAFGAAATAGAGFVGTIIDNSGGTKTYVCWSDGSAWNYALGTAAA